MLDYKYIQIVITFLRNSDILPFASIFSPLFLLVLSLSLFSPIIYMIYLTI
jgi:hypothetical protein